MTLERLPSFDEVEQSRQMMWYERSQVTAHALLVYRICTVCGWDTVGTTEARADDALANHVIARHGRYLPNW